MTACGIREKMAASTSLLGAVLLMIHFVHALLWLFAAAGIGLSVWSAQRASDARELERAGIVVMGEVVKVDHEIRWTRRNDEPVAENLDIETVEWRSIDGMLQRCRLEERWERDGLKGRPVGTKIELLTDPAKPNEAIEANESKAFFNRTAGAVFGLVFAAAALFMQYKLGGFGMTGLLTLVFEAAAAVACASPLAAWRRRRKRGGRSSGSRGGPRR